MAAVNCAHLEAISSPREGGGIKKMKSLRVESDALMSLESASGADVMAPEKADFTLRRRGRQILIHPPKSAYPIYISKESNPFNFREIGCLCVWVVVVKEGGGCESGNHGIHESIPSRRGNKSGDYRRCINLVSS